MNSRKSKAEAAFDARVQAFDDQAHRPVDASAGSSPPNVANSGQHQAPDEPRRPPARPRILGLENETNIVGRNQQEHEVIGGEKYGFYTVVNDAFSDGGPTASSFSSFRPKHTYADPREKYRRNTLFREYAEMVEGRATLEREKTPSPLNHAAHDDSA